MIKGKPWFAFFSHTGSEIYNLYKRTGIKPDKVITNIPPGDKRINKKLSNINTEFVFIPNKPSIRDYSRILNRCKDCICTLHGWMRIVPEVICEEYDFYNLHPGLITKYPELKGKDPQSRVDSEIHSRIGLVIHKVTAGVDEGPIIAESSCDNTFNGESQVTDRLKDMAVDTWLDAAKIHWRFKDNE